MTRVVMATTAAVLLSCGSAFAQVSGISPLLSPLGVTSPLGVGPGSPVPPTHIPLGATQLGAPGISPPMTSTAATTGTLPACSGSGGSMAQLSTSTIGNSTMGTSSTMGSSMTGTSSGMGTSTTQTSVLTTVFDGGGMAGTASGICATNAGSSLSGAVASASSPTGMGSLSAVGRTGITMGASELGPGGVSPMFPVLAPAMTLTPLAAPSSSSSSVPTLAPLGGIATTPLAVTDPSVPALAPLGGTATCSTTSTGLSATGGVSATAFGAPVTGRALVLAEGRCLAAR